MHILLGKKRFHLIVAATLIGLAALLLFRFTTHNEAPLVTATVERGTVTELVSVSGFVEAQNAAELAFPVTGIIDQVVVRVGDSVTQGDTLITLKRAGLQADRQNALSDLVRAQADRDELLAGPRDEARSITATEVAIAEEQLERTRREELEKVNNARRTLLSSNLIALSQNSNESATPPTVSGTYTCEEEGTYTVDIFRSSTPSGFSYRISGLEDGTYSAYTEQPGSFGACGLYLQLSTDSGYGNSRWAIHVPNTQASAYITNLNAYELAVKQAENSIRAAEQSLELATNQALLNNADPRTEELKRANAAVASAQARLAAIDAQLADRVITAPFDGVVTSLDILPGETVTTAPIVTVLANDEFDMTARIPEIDITKLSLEQHANIIFDARSDTVIPATIHFISPIAVEIDGVAYFEATLQFDEPPTWLRSGLNADVDIIVKQHEDVLRLPKRFVALADGAATVLLLGDKDTSIVTPVELLFSGNDGYVAIEGVPEGSVVVAP